MNIRNTHAQHIDVRSAPLMPADQPNQRDHHFTLGPRRSDRFKMHTRAVCNHLFHSMRAHLSSHTNDPHAHKDAFCVHVHMGSCGAVLACCESKHHIPYMMHICPMCATLYFIWRYVGRIGNTHMLLHVCVCVCRRLAVGRRRAFRFEWVCVCVCECLCVFVTIQHIRYAYKGTLRDDG